MITLSLVLAATLGVSPAEQADGAPVYVAGGQYTATLSQSSGRWQLMPMTGNDATVLSHCLQETHLPPGIWLINRNTQGEAELIAPSGTALPPGYRDRVPLASCDSRVEDALRAPAELVDWLVEHTGAVWIGE